MTFVIVLHVSDEAPRVRISLVHLILVKLEGGETLAELEVVRLSATHNQLRVTHERCVVAASKGRLDAADLHSDPLQVEQLKHVDVVEHRSALLGVVAATIHHC